MITFDPPITINPPPYSDGSGNVTHPQPLELAKLNVSYIDTPEARTVIARIEHIPNVVTVYSGDEYDAVGDWTQSQVEQKLVEILGSNPAVTLRGLFPRTMEEDPNGPGTLLSKMIKSMGIVMSDSCSCRRHAIAMNTSGNDWCEQNIDTIVGWLRDEAKRRGLPFVDLIGKLMVTRAIKKSRKLLANQPVPENDEELDNE